MVKHLPLSTAAPGYRGVPGQSGASVFMVEHLPRSTAAPGYRGVPGQSAGLSVVG